MDIGYSFNADHRQYTITEMIGRGANTAAYLAECRNGDLITKCILKEYSPQNIDDFESGKLRFIESGKLQNSIRQLSSLNNMTPPVNRIFEANGTAYIDVSCYNGTTLDKLNDLTLSQYIAICSTISKTAGYFHNEGYLCLDIKPENIFILKNTDNDIITQLAEFIDFGSIRKISDSNAVFSYTREWAAPEQLNPYSFEKISTAADIYTIGEMIFNYLFGRHSYDKEHREFSKYPFDECKRQYRRYAERPDVRSVFTNIFRNTLRSSASNRFQNIEQLTELLDKLAELLEQREYIVPVFPAVPSYFTGRRAELAHIKDELKNNPVLYITGIGGIGKSTLVKAYISKCKTDYDIIAFLEYDGDFKHTFCDDTQLQISTLSKNDNESTEDYFTRKLACFKRICGNKRVLFAVDNFNDRLTKEFSSIINSGYDTIITSRSKPPKNSFPFIELGAIKNKSEVFRLIGANLERSLTKEERICFDEIINIVQGHTLVIELIARQIAAGRLNIHKSLAIIREYGFLHFSDEEVGNYKDGEEIYGTLSAIISALFSAGDIRIEERSALKILSLLNIRGLENELVKKFYPEIKTETISKLSAEGWVYYNKRVHIHPVISETVQNWKWSDEDVMVMEYHKKAIDIYVGMSDAVRIRKILHSADAFRNCHKRHIISAMYYDMKGCYYDVLLNGAYYPENENEEKLLNALTDSMNMAITEINRSADSRKTKYLLQYYLSMASILIRSYPDKYKKAALLLKRAYSLIKENEPKLSDNHCYFYMVSAWYYTLAKPDMVTMKKCTQKAARIARQVFPTELEIIDIIHIPTANCYFYHNEYKKSAEILRIAVDICKKYPDILPYTEKQTGLLSCMIDVYNEMGDAKKCEELKAEIEYINEVCSKLKDIE